MDGGDGASVPHHSWATKVPFLLSFVTPPLCGWYVDTYLALIYDNSTIPRESPRATTIWYQSSQKDILSEREQQFLARGPGQRKRAPLLFDSHKRHRHFHSHSASVSVSVRALFSRLPFWLEEESISVAKSTSHSLSASRVFWRSLIPSFRQRIVPNSYEITYYVALVEIRQ